MAVWIGGGVHGFQCTAIWAVVDALAPFVLDSFPLYFKFFFGNRIEEHPHAVRFQPQYCFQLVRGYRLVVVGAVGIGGAVHAATGFGDDAEVLFIPHIHGALKHHVLKEMRETGTARIFAVGAHVVGHIHMYQWIGVVLVQDDGQAVVELVFAVGDGDLGTVAIEGLHQGDPRGEGGLLCGLARGGGRGGCLRRFWVSAFAAGYQDGGCENQGDFCAVHGGRRPFYFAESPILAQLADCAGSMVGGDGRGNGRGEANVWELLAHFSLYR